ncbi:hypothetical protein BJ165DRAFT_344400 [Panaeolus papilionaceus]|nr:hypothetical protein BJ165DRAFT_344400 [Panaeolus papilionaceus]
MMFWVFCLLASLSILIRFFCDGSTVTYRLPPPYHHHHWRSLPFHYAIVAALSADTHEIPPCQPDTLPKSLIFHFALPPFTLWVLGLNPSQINPHHDGFLNLYLFTLLFLCVSQKHSPLFIHAVSIATIILIFIWVLCSIFGLLWFLLKPFYVFLLGFWVIYTVFVVWLLCGVEWGFRGVSSPHGEAVVKNLFRASLSCFGLFCHTYVYISLFVSTYLYSFS